MLMTPQKRLRYDQKMVVEVNVRDKMITLYHGTSSYNLESFLTSLPRKRMYWHCIKKGFCTSVSFEEASFFAIRKCSIDDFKAGCKNYGIVLEFDFNYTRLEDCQEIMAGNTLRDEKEIIVFNVKNLKLVAIYRYRDDQWNRILL